MERQLVGRKAIVLQGKPLPLTEYDEKVDIIAFYLEKFGAIAGRTITPQVYAIYVEALEDFELRKIRKGMVTALREAKRFPWPAELVEWIEEEV